MKAFYCISDSGHFESIQKAETPEQAAAMHVAEHLDELFGITEAEDYDVKVSEITPPMPYTVDHKKVVMMLAAINPADDADTDDGEDE